MKKLIVILVVVLFSSVVLAQQKISRSSKKIINTVVRQNVGKNFVLTGLYNGSSSEEDALERIKTVGLFMMNNADWLEPENIKVRTREVYRKLREGRMEVQILPYKRPKLRSYYSRSSYYSSQIPLPMLPGEGGSSYSSNSYRYLSDLSSLLEDDEYYEEEVEVSGSLDKSKPHTRHFGHISQSGGLRKKKNHKKGFYAGVGLQSIKPLHQENSLIPQLLFGVESIISDEIVLWELSIGNSDSDFYYGLEAKWHPNDSRFFLGIGMDTYYQGEIKSATFYKILVEVRPLNFLILQLNAGNQENKERSGFMIGLGANLILDF